MKMERVSIRTIVALTLLAALFTSTAFAGENNPPTVTEALTYGTVDQVDVIACIILTSLLSIE